MDKDDCLKLIISLVSLITSLVGLAVALVNYETTRLKHRKRK